MPRTADDSWDIATSVGATAVMVALARAAETASADPLIRDEFAEPLVSTPELAGVREQVATWWTPEPQDGDEEAADLVVDAQQMINYQAVRTHFFDAYFAEAVAAGVRQVVILAAGLDSRAYRLPWPDGTVVYEIDLPKVLEYKEQTLAAHGRPRPPTGAQCPSTCATTGRRHCAMPVTTPSGRPPGWPKGCCRFSRQLRRKRCSARSTR